MTTRNQKLWVFAIVMLSFFMTTCRKDISVPNQDLDKLFTTWNWVQSTGGFAGQVTSPATTGYSQTIEFGRDGIYKRYKNGKLLDKFKFTLSEGTSIFSTGSAFLIKYEQTGIFSSNDSPMISQSIKFSGQDTLFLNDEVYDGYSNIYTKSN